MSSNIYRAYGLVKEWATVLPVVATSKECLVEMIRRSGELSPAEIAGLTGANAGELIGNLYRQLVLTPASERPHSMARLLSRLATELFVATPGDLERLVSKKQISHPSEDNVSARILMFLVLMPYSESFMSFASLTSHVPFEANLQQMAMVIVKSASDRGKVFSTEWLVDQVLELRTTSIDQILRSWKHAFYNQHLAPLQFRGSDALRFHIQELCEGFR